MNDLDRDKFYGTDDEWDDDGVEYEVEPPDADVLAAEQRRARDAVEEAESAVDVDQIYRELGSHPDHELSDHWAGNFRFQFGIKHLLVAMAVVAVVLTLLRLQFSTAVLVVLLIAGIAGAIGYLELKEERRRADARRRWQDKYERQRRIHQRRLELPKAAAASGSIYDDVPFADAPPPARAIEPSAADPNVAPPRMRFQFSMRQLMIAMTIASVTLGATYLLGGPANTAALMGLVVFAGLVMHALGAEPPEIAVMGWWLLLVLYLLLTLVAAVANRFA